MDIKLSITRFLSLFDSEISEEESSLKQLVIELDRLALACSIAEYELDQKLYDDPPKQDYEAARQLVIRHFPSLGFYNEALEMASNVANTSLVLGDAIDDIADIVLEMKDTHWRFENTSKNNAIFHLKDSFESHWGRHLRSLQFYLYDLKHSN